MCSSNQSRLKCFLRRRAGVSHAHRACIAGTEHSSSLNRRMISNRRNFYRVLQVQPEAPAEVVKAAYRALMTLHHPDLGGDHAIAVSLNEAYAVLSNPSRRSAYDKQRTAKSHRKSAANAPIDPAPAQTRHPLLACAFCELGVSSAIRADSRCTRCRAPLAAVARGDASKSNERRGMLRVSKSDWALLHTDWRADAIDVRMRDLSLDGLSVYSGAALPLHRRVRVAGAAFDVVADIVQCHRVNNVFTLHGRVLTALFSKQSGGFVSTTA